MISARSELIPNFISLFDLAQIEWEEFVEEDSAHWWLEEFHSYTQCVPNEAILVYKEISVYVF